MGSVVEEVGHLGLAFVGDVEPLAVSLIGAESVGLAGSVAAALSFQWRWSSSLEVPSTPFSNPEYRWRLEPPFLYLQNVACKFLVAASSALPSTMD